MEKPSLDTAKAGAMRFNTDSSQMEIYDGNQWTGILATSPEQQTGGTRMLVLGGYNTTAQIDLIEISTTGDATDFGDLLTTMFATSGAGSRVAAFRIGGNTPAARNDIGKSIFASQGTEVDTNANCLTTRTYSGALSDSTRACFAGNNDPAQVNSIEFFSMTTTGDSVDFGDLSYVLIMPATFASPTRGIFSGGQNSSSPTGVSNIEYITISTKGDAADFGDLVDARSQLMGCSNAVRGLISGGGEAPGNGVNTIEFVTIATLGNTQDFGDMTYTNNRDGASGASPTRGIVGAGGDNFASPYAKTTNIDFVQIMTTGNAFDFGDLDLARNHMGAATNGHGGL